eukprot:CAMPEP_0194048980 /NCGR_PEP_ID=MMETSP0009_2-20130614/29254_1 /TAXON_ID=210454 /ORGANISM="Grammatophora oceanica, Strain CCMP 410" /LENGTH=117 /DNA_ID=CAMNT_0038695025 /DNA_START=267 /DNA_END=620 /DNA_ORIENTATION=+
MTLQKICNCPASDSGPFYMKIENQEVTEQNVLNSGLCPSGPCGLVASEAEVPTMDELFAKIEILCFTDCLEGGTMAAHECKMTYSRTTGAIESLYIDLHSMIADEEEWYLVNEVTSC